MITRKIKIEIFFLFTFSFDSEHCAPFTITFWWGHFWRGGEGSACPSLWHSRTDKEITSLHKASYFLTIKHMEQEAVPCNLFLITSKYNNLYNILVITMIKLNRFSERILNLSRYAGYQIRWMHSLIGKIPVQFNFYSLHHAFNLLCIYFSSWAQTFVWWGCLPSYSY